MHTLSQVLTSLHITHTFDTEAHAYHITGLPDGCTVIIYVSTTFWREPGVKYYFVNQYNANGDALLQAGTKSIQRLLLNLGAALYESYIKWPPQSPLNGFLIGRSCPPHRRPTMCKIYDAAIKRAQESSRQEIEHRTRRYFDPETGIQSIYFDGKLLGTKQVRVTYINRKPNNTY